MYEAKDAERYDLALNEACGMIGADGECPLSAGLIMAGGVDENAWMHRCGVCPLDPESLVFDEKCDAPPVIKGCWKTYFLEQADRQIQLEELGEEY